jgi:trimethylamine--corrinoid protein Co-methyltransferase
MKLSFNVLTKEEIQGIHEASLTVLAETGMRFESSALLEGLKKSGARVDEASKTALFPEKLVEDAVEGSRRQIRSGGKLHLLNGVTSERSEGDGIAAKISGGCEQFFDWESRSIREASATELLSSVRLGELLPEVSFVGNPLVMRSDLEGNRIKEKLRRVKTAALIAKNTRKIGSMEVWDEREIDFMVEIGIIARGSKEAYFGNPCLLTAKETISPLFLDANSGDILLADDLDQLFFQQRAQDSAGVHSPDLLDVHHALAVQQLFGTDAVGADGGGVHENFGHGANSLFSAWW